MIRNWIFSLIFVMLVLGIKAQPMMVKDIYPDIDASIDIWLYDHPSDAQAGINGIYYFAADDGIHGIELWKSDGTESGTVMVKDINPDGSAAPAMYHVLNDLLYFVANDGTHGEEIWRSDGTEAGTYMLKDVAAGTTSGVTEFTEMEVVENFVFFSLDDGVHGNELWRTDGTEAGTILVKDMVEGSAPSTPGHLYNWNGILYYAASSSDDNAGEELYRTDGTEEGTYLLKNIYNGIVGSTPDRFTAAGNFLYFIANDGTHGNELWRTDGTEAGTHLVADIREGIYTPFEYDFELYPIGDQLLFVASLDNDTEADLWVTDGTSEGTQRIYEYSDIVGVFVPTDFQLFQDEVYFIANDVFTEEDGVWKTDGTAEGTQFVTDFTGSTSEEVDLVFLPYEDRLFHVDRRSSNGYELWEIDAETEEATLVEDIYPGFGSSYPGNLIITNDKLFFAADDGLTGAELWVYNLLVEELLVSVEQIAPVLCNGDANAALSVMPSGGVPPYSYNWSDSSVEGANPSGLSAGTYGLTVTDETGTTFETEVVITEPDPLTITLSALEPENNNQQDGTIWINPEGGTAPLDIEWDIEPAPDNPLEIHNLSAGEYTVTITDANGCQIQETYVVDLVLATSEPGAKWLSKAFPNPVKSILQLEIDQQDQLPKHIRIVDAFGKILLELPFTKTIDMSKLPSGSYMLEVIGDNAIQVIPIIKQ